MGSFLFSPYLFAAHRESCSYVCLMVRTRPWSRDTKSLVRTLVCADAVNEPRRGRQITMEDVCGTSIEPFEAGRGYH